MAHQQAAPSISEGADVRRHRRAQVRARDLQGVGDELHQKPPVSDELVSKVGFFCARLGQGFLEQLDLERLVSELLLELADPLLQPSQLAVGDDPAIVAHRFAAALAHPLSPAEQQVRRDPVLPGDARDGKPRLQALLDDALKTHRTSACA
jgi:hypothetical protein